MKHMSGDQSLVRKSNQRSILQYLKEKGPTSKSDLAKNLNISKPTVAKNTELLIREGLVYEYGEGKSSGGRPPMLLDFHEQYKYILTLEINIKHPIISICNLRGKIVDKKKTVIDENSTKGEFFKKIFKEINQILTKNSIGNNKIAIISVSTPGIIDEKTGEIIANPQFKKWTSINLKERLEKKYGIDVIIKNDVSMAALGEKHYGIGKKYDSLVYISSLRGLGAGLIINGELYEGKRKAAGEIGYFINSDEVKEDSNLENRISIPVILNNIRKDIINHQQTVINDYIDGDLNNISVEVIEKALSTGDGYTIDLISRVSRELGAAINNISILLDLEGVIIGGDLRKLGIHLFQGIRDIVQRNNPIKTDILPSSLGENASIYGSCIVGLDRVENQLIK